jgi:hypothetical protein
VALVANATSATAVNFPVTCPACQICLAFAPLAAIPTDTLAPLRLDAETHEVPLKVPSFPFISDTSAMSFHRSETHPDPDLYRNHHHVEHRLRARPLRLHARSGPRCGPPSVAARPDQRRRVMRLHLQRRLGPAPPARPLSCISRPQLLPRRGFLLPLGERRQYPRLPLPCFNGRECVLQL